MSDNNEPLELAPIEKWYDGLFKPEVNEVYDPWAKYIAALVAEVKRLRREINQRWKYDREAFSMTGLFFPPYPDEVEE